MSLTTNLISYWKMDESSGNAADSSGNGYTLTNNNTVSFAAAKINNGADFGASNTNKSLTTANNLGIDGGAMSISCWIKPTALPSSSSDPFATSTFNFAGQSSSASSVQYNLSLANVSGDQRVYFSRWRDSAAITGAWGSVSVSTSAFTHVVGTYDGTTLTVYVNAVAQANTVTQSGTGSGGSTQTSLGDRKGSVAYYPGLVDEVGYWSRALSSTEVTQLYNGGAGIQYPFTVLALNNRNFLAFM
jgi:hypothetical protein